MDQITLVGPHDVTSLSLHIRFSQRNIRFLRNSFYIIPATPEIQRYCHEIQNTMERPVRERIVFITEDELLSPAVCINPWIYQQLLKLSVASVQKKYSISEPFFFSDVDTLSVSPIVEQDIMRDGKYLFWITQYQSQDTFYAVDCSRIATLEQLPSINQHTLSWLMGFTWTTLNLLGLRHMQCMCAVNACVIWYGRVLTQLIAFLEQRYGQPFYKTIIACFQAFIEEHKQHFYAFDGFRKVLMSYYPSAGLQPYAGSQKNLFAELRVGFSEWQLYTFFLSILPNQPYCLQFQPPHTNMVISEFNADVQQLATLTAALTFIREGKSQQRFINFYPNITPAVEHILEKHYTKTTT